MRSTNASFTTFWSRIDENGTKTTYVKMTPEKALRVVNDHIVNGNVVTEYTIGANQK